MPILSDYLVVNFPGKSEALHFMRVAAQDWYNVTIK